MAWLICGLLVWLVFFSGWVVVLVVGGLVSFVGLVLILLLIGSLAMFCVSGGFGVVYLV